MFKRLLCGAVVAVCAAQAKGDDWFPADWRGEPQTIVAAWDYWGLAGSGPRLIMPGYYQANPDIFTDPRARAYIDSEVLVHNSLFGRQSVLEVGYRGIPGELAFAISNYSGYAQMFVRFQITYWPSGGAPMNFGVGVVGGDPPWFFMDYEPAVVTDAHMHPDGWRTAAYDLLIEPGDTFGGLGVVFTELPVYVDQVWIDTWAIPSAGASSLLAAAGLLTVHRRR